MKSDLSPDQLKKRSKTPNSIETLTLDPKILNKIFKITPEPP